MTQQPGANLHTDAQSQPTGRDTRTSAGGERALGARPPPAPSGDPMGSGDGLSGAGQRPPLLLSGIDSLYASYYVDTKSGTLDWDELAYEKETIRQSRGNRFKELPFGSEQLALMPSGGHPYTYVLRNADFIIRLGENIVPACHVQFLSKGLWANGHKRQHERIKAWLGSVGLRLTRPEALGRVDFSFDYHVPVIDFGSPNIVSRAEVEANWLKNKQAETFQIGKGDTVIRLYNKVAEIRQASEKLWFFDLWGMSEEVWRIEVQLRTERLKQGAIRTVEDLDSLGADTLREIVGKHTTLRVVTPDTNRSRWPLHPLWQALQNDVEAMDQTGLVRNIQDKAGIDWRRRRLLLSVYGFMKRLGTFEAMQSGGKALPDLDWTIEALLDGLREIHDPINWRNEIERLLAEERLAL
jgi:hypothetical protein